MCHGYSGFTFGMAGVPRLAGILMSISFLGILGGHGRHMRF